MSKAIREHIRSNVVGYIAIFMFAIGGTAYGLDGTNTVDSGDIINDQVRSADVRDDTLANGGLQAADLGPDSVGSSEVAEGAITSEEVLDDTARGGLTAADLDSFSVGTSEIALHSVVGTRVADSAINSAHLGADSVGSSEIASGAVGSSEIASGAVGTSAVATDSLSAADLASGSVGTSEVATESIGTFDIAPNAVTGSRVAPDAVTGSRVEDGSLTPEDLGVFYAKVNNDGTVAAQSGGVTVSKQSGVATYTVDFGRSVTNCGYVATPITARFQAAARISQTDPQDVTVDVHDYDNDPVPVSGFSVIVVC